MFGRLPLEFAAGDVWFLDMTWTGQWVGMVPIIFDLIRIFARRTDCIIAMTKNEGVFEFYYWFLSIHEFTATFQDMILKYETWTWNLTKSALVQSQKCNVVMGANLFPDIIASVVLFNGSSRLNSLEKTTWIGNPSIHAMLPCFASRCFDLTNGVVDNCGNHMPPLSIGRERPDLLTGRREARWYRRFVAPWVSSWLEIAQEIWRL